MIIKLPYGDTGLTVSIPDRNLEAVLSPNRVQLPEDENRLIESALDEPVGTPPLEDLLAAKKERIIKNKLCIAVEDLTRSAPADRVLPRLLEKLNRAGVTDDLVFGIMALGTHRYMTEEEIRCKVGAEAFKRIPFYNSQFKNPAGLTDFGADERIPLRFDTRFVDAGFRITLGSIVPHPIGWSGGAKTVVPGVTGSDTVAAFHLILAQFEKNEFGTVITPARRLIEGWVGRLGLDFSINCITTPEKKLYRVVAGDFIQAQRQGVVFGKEVYGVRARKRTDLVITNSYPAEIDFWQAQKAFNSGEILTRPGGEVVLLTPCPEGIGPHPDLPELYERARRDPQKLLKLALAGKVSDPISASSGLSKAIAVLPHIRAGIICDTIAESAARKFGFTKYASVEELIERKIRENQDITITVITHGGYLCPLLDS